MEEAYAGIAEAERSICLLSSYVWNSYVNLAAAKNIKALAPNSIIILPNGRMTMHIGHSRL